jgi:hypothetical protein
MYLTHLLFIAAQMCNGINVTYYLYALNVTFLITTVSHTATDNSNWNYMIFRLATVVKQLLNHFLQILIKQKQ